MWYEHNKVHFNMRYYDGIIAKEKKEMTSPNEKKIKKWIPILTIVKKALNFLFYYYY